MSRAAARACSPPQTLRRRKITAFRQSWSRSLRRLTRAPMICRGDTASSRCRRVRVGGAAGHTATAKAKLRRRGSARRWTRRAQSAATRSSSTTPCRRAVERHAVLCAVQASRRFGPRWTVRAFSPAVPIAWRDRAPLPHTTPPLHRAAAVGGRGADGVLRMRQMRAQVFSKQLNGAAPQPGSAASIGGQSRRPAVWVLRPRVGRRTCASLDVENLFTFRRMGDRSQTGPRMASILQC